MESIFKHAPDHPFHISVGAVLVNGEGKIRVHRVRVDDMRPDSRYKLAGLSEAYLLMRESVENGESLEETLMRGIKEEFGAEGDLKKYLGSQQDFVPEKEGFEKTTLYFHVSFTKDGEPTNPDMKTTLEWMDPHELLAVMKTQGAASKKADLDEAKIIEAYLKYGV